MVVHKSTRKDFNRRVCHWHNKNKKILKNYRCLKHSLNLPPSSLPTPCKDKFIITADIEQKKRLTFALSLLPGHYSYIRVQ